MSREDDETKTAIPTPLRSVGVGGELIRIRHALERLKATLPAVELALQEAEKKIPPGAEPGQALVSTTLEIVTGLAKVDALIRSAG